MNIRKEFKFYDSEVSCNFLELWKVFKSCNDNSCRERKMKEHINNNDDKFDIQGINNVVDEVDFLDNAENKYKGTIPIVLTYSISVPTFLSTLFSLLNNNEVVISNHATSHVIEYIVLFLAFFFMFIVAYQRVFDDKKELYLFRRTLLNIRNDILKDQNNNNQ